MNTFNMLQELGFVPDDFNVNRLSAEAGDDNMNIYFTTNGEVVQVIESETPLWKAIVRALTIGRLDNYPLED